MNPTELLGWTLVLGIGGSLAIDLWALALRRTSGVSSLDYRLLGRWIGHFPRGTFWHQRIGSAPAITWERPLGWLAHYSIGIAFALLLLLLVGHGWANSPTPWQPLALGISTIAAPWLVMQPAFGMGFAGSRTPKPWLTRLRNLGTHTAFGVGLYVTAIALSTLS